MRWSTRSEGNLKTPIRSDDRMTSCVTLSSARPRNPFRSPARIQRGALGRPDVGGIPGGGDELTGERPGPLRERRAPGEAPPVVGDVAELELHRRRDVPQEAQPRPIGRTLTLVLGVQHDLESRI